MKIENVTFEICSNILDLHTHVHIVFCGKWNSREAHIFEQVTVLDDHTTDILANSFGYLAYPAYENQ